MSIVVEELTKRYGGHPVVNNISLEVADGEYFVLLGSSGSGKSTLLRMIAGLTDIDAGRILLHGRDVSDLPPARRGVGFVFQNYALFRGMSVAENVEFALSIRGVPKPARRRRRDELLEMVGLAGLGGRMPRQLSGGQQQRVALARALAHEPEVLLLDEPFGALDAKVRLELRRTIREIQRELGITTVFVTHDQEEAFELADRLAVLSFGRLLEVGPPEEPTAVASIALASIYAGNGWIGSWLEPLGLQVAYTPLGVVVALTFIGLPFVVRTVPPVLRDLDPEVEEAAASLGAGRWQTIRRVTLPELVPAVAAGFVLAFARALGEYGSVIFIAGNMPMRSEITPLLIMIQLEQYDYAGATAIALVFLMASFSLLFLINFLSWRRNRRLGDQGET